MNNINTPLVWTASIRKVSDLKDLENNPRKITEDKFELLKHRIKERGFHDVLKLDTNDFILSGNQRKKALTQLGITEVNTLSPNRELTEEERNAIIVESNKSDGMFDFELLGSMFDIDELKDLGFSELELGLNIDKIIDNKEIDIDELENTLECECPKCGFKFNKQK